MIHLGINADPAAWEWVSELINEAVESLEPEVHIIDPNSESNALIPTTVVKAVVAARNAAMNRVRSAAHHIEIGRKEASEAKALARKAHFGYQFTPVKHSESADYKSLFGSFDPEAAIEAFRKAIDARTWVYLIERTGIADMMDKQDHEKLRKDLSAQVPEVTEESVESILSELSSNSRNILLRGVANAFGELSRQFKSHDPYKFERRIILEEVFNKDGWMANSHNLETTLRDVERVFRILDDDREDEPDEYGRKYRQTYLAIKKSREGLDYGARQSEAETEYFRIRVYMNGNVHLWFKRRDLVERVNLLLAEWYGAVLPDAVPAEDESFKTKTGALSRDLAFYWTSEEVVKKYLLRDVYLSPGKRILEPSAGEGHIAKHLVATGVEVVGVEVDPGRFRKLSRIRGVKALQANFLQLTPTGDFDYVVMNPPFYGTHWMEHVRHAWDFLKPQGVLVAVLPITAWTTDIDKDHRKGKKSKHSQFRNWVRKIERRSEPYFLDLPAGSFKDAGTNINTVILVMRRYS